MEAMKATKGAVGRRGGMRKKSISKSIKAGLQFPVGHIARFLKKERYAQRTSTGLQFLVGCIARFPVACITRFLQFPFCF